MLNFVHMKELFEKPKISLLDSTALDLIAPPSTQTILGDYLSEYSIVYETNHSSKKRELSSEVLGPDIWNIYVGRIERPECVTLIGYEGC